MDLKLLGHQIKAAKSIAILTGAGVSAESGVATFRGQDGLWENYSLEDVATPEGFRRNPELVWSFYNQRIRQRLSVKPNPGHHALSQLQKLVPQVTLITQNIDGLHQEAHCTDILEMHGNLMRVRCVRCRSKSDIDEPFKEALPRCDCGGLLRPDVVWFGEILDEKILQTCFEKSATCDVFLCIGTSSLVSPASTLAGLAKNNGAYTCEMNLEPTPNSHLMDLILTGKSGEILPKLISLLESLL